ncbi:MAG TPA: hypothetical protein VMI54_24825 [Polyangiaceae bacterium]|nr:hypothetical protein [Polyangiaceae bacterium]
MTLGGTPTSLAVANGTVFWSGGLGSGASVEFGIFSVPASGGASTLFLSASGTANATPDSLVALGGALYWQLPGDDGGTWTMPTAGGTATELMSIPDLKAQRQGIAAAQVTSSWPLELRLLLSFTSVLSTDPSNSHLWAFGRSTFFPTWQTTTLVDGDVSDSIGVYYPDNVTMDATNAYFVSNRSTGGNGVYQISRSGGTPLLLAATADHQSPIATYGGNVYFVTSDSIVTVPVGGGTQSTLVTDAGPPTTFAVDGATLYWTCTTCGTVSKMAFTGGAVTTVASGEQAPEFLAVDASNLYWGATNAVRTHTK